MRSKPPASPFTTAMPCGVLRSNAPTLSPTTTMFSPWPLPFPLFYCRHLHPPRLQAIATVARMRNRAVIRAKQSAQQTWWRTCMMLLVLLYAPEFWSAAAEDSTGCTTTTLGLALPLTVAVWESGDQQAIRDCNCIPDYAFMNYGNATHPNVTLRDISNIMTVGVQAFAGFHGTLIFGSKHGKGAPQLISVGVSCPILRWQNQTFVLPFCRAHLHASRPAANGRPQGEHRRDAERTVWGVLCACRSNAVF